MVNKEGIEYVRPKYYKIVHHDNGDVEIVNGKQNHIFEWYEYSDEDPNWDHPKHAVLDHIDDDVLV